MFRHSLSNALLVVLICLIAARAADETKAKVGEKAPTFSLKATDGSEHALKDLRGRIVVLEWSNAECPEWERVHKTGIMRETYDSVRKLHPTIAWLAIDSTDGATARQVNAAIRTLEIPYPVLLDGAGTVGRSFDARMTPQVFIIDAEGTLVYSGAIDNDALGKKAEAGEKVTNFVTEAVTAMKEGVEIRRATTRPYGSSIRYRKNDRS